MNSNDLADRLEEFYQGTHITKAAETLRTQQSEIEELKVLLDKTLNNWAKDMERLKK
jgi:hypothetical protein